MTLTKRFSIVCILFMQNQPPMAQRSKKDHIVRTALPLFLENGFKGTSIDLVVKKSKVSKPTVYNHFPDKAALILAVIKNWTQSKPTNLPAINDITTLEKTIQNLWLKTETVNFYALVIGEGRRFPDAKKLFWESFDEPWRQALIAATSQVSLPTLYSIDLLMDQLLFNRLKQL